MRKKLLSFCSCLVYNSLFTPRNCRFYRNGNSANFLSYVCNDKFFFRFVYPYLKQNSCYYSICVFYASRFFGRYIERFVVTRLNKTSEESQKSNTVSEVKDRHRNSVASHKFARVDKSIIYIITHEEKKHPFTCYLAAKRPKSSKFVITNMRK